MTEHTTIEHLAECIKHAEGECVFLIGAGFSVSGGVPLAGKLVSEIKQEFPEAYDRAKSDNYNHVMGKLSPHQRAKLLNKYIDKARVNWAHLMLAKLFKADIVDRILTLNFDTLILKACSIVAEFPAVYDLATASQFKESRISPKSVFFLNGQHTGFAMLNSDDEFSSDQGSHKDRLTEIVKETGGKRIWVVVGYSGEADPLAKVLEYFAKTSGFDSSLFWVGYSAEPSETQLKVLRKPNTLYIGNQDADEFMRRLVKLLGDDTGSLMPSILVDPFTHIKETLDANIDFSTGGKFAEELYRRLLKTLEKAEHANKETQNAPEDPFNIIELVLSGKYDRVHELWLAHGNQFSEDQKADAAWAYVLAGVALDDQARALASSDLGQAQQLWSEACEKYEQALNIKPDNHQALNNWGAALNEQAQALPSSELEQAQKLWSEACDKFEQALKIKPDKHEALSNWAGTLSEEYHFVRNSDPDRSKELLDKVGELLEQGIKLAPGIYAYNYACYWSIKSDPVKSVNWLKIVKEYQKLPNKQHIDEDKDFNNIRESQVFIDWYESEFGNHVD